MNPLILQLSRCHMWLLQLGFFQPAVPDPTWLRNGCWLLPAACWKWGSFPCWKRGSRCLGEGEKLWLRSVVSHSPARPKGRW